MVLPWRLLESPQWRAELRSWPARFPAGAHFPSPSAPPTPLEPAALGAPADIAATASAPRSRAGTVHVAQDAWKEYDANTSFLLSDQFKEWTASATETRQLLDLASFTHPPLPYGTPASALVADSSGHLRCGMQLQRLARKRVRRAQPECSTAPTGYEHGCRSRR